MNDAWLVVRSQILSYRASVCALQFHITRENRTRCIQVVGDGGWRRKKTTTYKNQIQPVDSRQKHTQFQTTFTILHTQNLLFINTHTQKINKAKFTHSSNFSVESCLACSVWNCFVLVQWQLAVMMVVAMCLPLCVCNALVYKSPLSTYSNTKNQSDFPSDDDIYWMPLRILVRFCLASISFYKRGSAILSSSLSPFIECFECQIHRMFRVSR